MGGLSIGQLPFKGKCGISAMDRAYKPKPHVRPSQLGNSTPYVFQILAIDIFICQRRNNVSY